MDDIKANIIKVKDKGYVVAVPYTNERFLDDDFYQKLSAAVMQECGEDGLPVIYVGHASIMDLDYDGHKTADESKYVGNIECTSVERIGDVYDYIALGHIHKAQTFYNDHARDCGSPIPVSFDEVKPGYDHGFTVVQIAARGEVPQISTVPVMCVCPLVNIPSMGFASWEDAMAELKKFPAGLEAYIRLNIEVDEQESLPYDREVQISNALLGKLGKYCLINVKRKSSVAVGKSEVAPMELEELQNEDPLTLVKRYFASEGIEFIGDFEDMFNEAVAAVKSVQDEN
jgi:exonuclease SbcD